MSSPIRIVALGVDARSMTSGLDRSGRWEYVHPSNGLVIEVHADETRDHWIVEMEWRGIRIRERDGHAFTASDAYDIVAQHVQHYVPKLHNLLLDLEFAEALRLQTLRSEHDDAHAEAMDEVNCG